MEALLAAVFTALVTGFGSYLLYRATRQHDEPALKTSDAAAASQAWAEYAKEMHERLRVVEAQLAECEAAARRAQQATKASLKDRRHRLTEDETANHVSTSDRERRLSDDERRAADE